MLVGMNQNIGDLRDLAKEAGRHMKRVGWTQGAEKKRGKVSIIGAINHCETTPGDAQILHQVLHHRGRAEDWNDQQGRTEDQVVGFLKRTVIDTDTLTEVFGPQYRQVLGIVRTLASAYEPDLYELSNANAKTPSRLAAYDSAWDAAHAVARDAGRDQHADYAWNAAYNDRLPDADDSALFAAADAAAAVAVRDIIPAEHYRTLTHAWRTVFGGPHTSDKA